MKKHWMYNFFHKKWSRDYNCWDHFVQVQREHFDVKTFEKLDGILSIKSYDKCLDFIKNNPSLKKYWKVVGKPNHGDALIFVGGPLRVHIGTFIAIDTGGMLHCTKKNGVIFTRLNSFVKMGFDKFLIMRHRALI